MRLDSYHSPNARLAFSLLTPPDRLNRRPVPEVSQPEVAHGGGDDSTVPPSAATTRMSAQDHAFSGAGGRGVWEAHHAERIEQSHGTGENRNEKCYLKG